MDSILTSIKKLLGITEEYEQFDLDIITHINSVFAILTQLGVGPSEGFSITDKYTTWDDYIHNDAIIHPVKTYMGLKVKQMFDPPDRSAIADATNKVINELEWRLLIQADKTTEQGGA